VKTKLLLLREVDSLALLEGPPEAQKVSIRSAAMLRIAALLGGWWKLLFVCYLFPRPLRDFMYDRLARIRYRLFKRYERCRIPSDEVRSRFVDIAE
jgi:predicted DCC family thiol-disulfide oxidoreductase YuxK